MSFRSPYNFDTDVSSFSSGLSLPEEDDMAQQSFKDECDINTLVKVYANTGVPGADIPPMVFEVDRVIDYQTALNELRAADEAFMSLPSGVREFFENDPAQLLDFVHTPENRDKAIELGLIPKPREDAPVLVRLSDALENVKQASPSQAAPPSDS